MWVKVFHKYFEEKKAQADRMEAQEAVWIQIRTMQEAILPPLQPLGSKGAITDLKSEVALVKCNNHASLNSSVAPGGTLTVELMTENNSSRNVQRRVSNVAAALASGNGGLGCIMGDLSSLVNLLNMNTRAL